MIISKINFIKKIYIINSYKSKNNMIILLINYKMNLNYNSINNLYKIVCFVNILKYSNYCL